jgi:RimJ/RimL family protein N-acetyltransferase
MKQHMPAYYEQNGYHPFEVIADYLIITGRLRLREFEITDAHSIYLLSNDPDVNRYTGDQPFMDVMHAAYYLNNYNDYKLYGYGRWAVEIKSTGEFIGWCGLSDSAELKEPELGIRFFKKHWGKGFASEAALASIRYGFNELDLTSIAGRAMKQNTAAIRLFEKCGMRFAGESEFEKHAGLLYRIRR